MKTGLKTIILGVILFVLGGVTFPVVIIVPLFLDDAINQQFSIPGMIQVVIKEPGRYYLWNNHQTIFNGTIYNRSEDLPDGIEISITDSTTGIPFNFFESSSISFSSGHSAKKSIGYIEVGNPTRVQVDIRGGDENRIFSFSQATFVKKLKRIFGGIILAFLAGLSGIGLVIWGVVKSTRARQRGDQESPEVPEMPEQAD